MTQFDWNHRPERRFRTHRELTRLLLIATISLGVLPGLSFAQTSETSPAVAERPAKPPQHGSRSLAPPTSLQVVDHPDDAGTTLDLTWELSADDLTDEKLDGDSRRLTTYEIYRWTHPDDLSEAERKALSASTSAIDGYLPVGVVTHQVKSFDDQKVKPGRRYKYRIRAVGPNGAKSQFTETSAEVVPRIQPFDNRRGWFGILLVLVGGSVILFILKARRGDELKIRRIAGLDAVEEAVGRATEMGRDILFVPGIQDINDIQTVAGITVLSRVAEVAADYDAPLEVPTARSLVMTTARETVEAAFLQAGRPDAYREDEIYYLTDEQFGYVASVTGTMLRKEPAACFYMGAFYAESLLLAETGNQIGAIQVAGTAMPSQLPFFVAACDYVLIGEEFFAASAYLSGEPQQLGSLKGQDVGKFLGGLFIVVGVLLATIASIAGRNEPGEAKSSSPAVARDYLKDHVLGNRGWVQ